MFERIDFDHDGKITKEEVLKRFTALDKNNDGIVNREEFLGEFHRPGRRAEDRPGLSLRPSDGQQGRPDRGGPGRFGPRSASEMIERFDKDKDGSLSKSEVPERLWDRLLQKVDADKNGVITKEELEKHLKSHQPPSSSGESKPATGAPTPSPKPDGENPPEVKKEESKPQARRLEPEVPADATAVVNAV